MNQLFLLSKEVFVRFLFLHPHIWLLNIHKIIVLSIPMAGQIAFNNAFLLKLPEDLVLEEVGVLVVIEGGVVVGRPGLDRIVLDDMLLMDQV